MASVLSALLTAYRAALVTAGLTNLPATISDEDAPAGTDDDVFSLRLLTSQDQLGPGSVFGGGHVDAEETIELTMHWNPQLDDEALANRQADDLLIVKGVMLKASNRVTGQQDVPRPQGWQIKTDTTDAVIWTQAYVVRCRETLNTL